MLNLCLGFSDESGFLIKKQQKGQGQGHPSLQQNQAVINWSEILPPPPQHRPGSGEYQSEDQLYSEIPEESAMAAMSACSCPVSHSHVMPGTSKSVHSDTHCNNCQSLRNFSNMPYLPRQLLQHIQASRHQPYPTNISRTGGSQQGSDSSSGTPVYLYGYSQPWDCAHPALQGTLEYDYAQVPVEDAYNYTQPIVDGRIEQLNTPNKVPRNPPKIHYGVPPGYIGGSEHYPYRGPYKDRPHIPAGGPPGNYCEGPFRGQIDSLDNKSSRAVSEAGTQLPYLEGYKIEPPASCASEYKVVGDSHSESGGSSGDRKRAFIGHMPEQERRQYPPPDTQRSEVIVEGYRRSADSSISEDPDYADESENGADTEHNNERGNHSFTKHQKCS